MTAMTAIHLAWILVWWVLFLLSLCVSWTLLAIGTGPRFATMIIRRVLL
jgi:hypothetical protein